MNLKKIISISSGLIALIVLSGSSPASANRYTYQRSLTSFRHYDFTAMESLNSDWEYHDDRYRVRDESMSYDRDICSENTDFSEEKGLRLRAYRQNSTDCGGGIHLKDDLLFGWVDVVVKLPRRDNEVHSSAWLFRPNYGNVGPSGRGLGYRELDIFEHFRGIFSNLSSISVGYHYGPNGDELNTDNREIGDIDLHKYHRFRLRWTPDNIAMFSRNMETDQQVGGHSFKPGKRRYLPNRLQQPMQLRIDINPRNRNMSGEARNLLVQSVTIYDCIELINNEVLGTCQPRLKK